jgi:hypothetical protein
MPSDQRAIAIQALLREWGGVPELQERFTPGRGDRFGRLLESGETVLITLVEFEALRDQGYIELLPGVESLELGARFRLTRRGRGTLARELPPGNPGPEISHLELGNRGAPTSALAGRLPCSSFSHNSSYRTTG